jgi:malate synthase
LIVQNKWVDFLTLPGYELILSNDEKKVCEEEVREPESVSSLFVTDEKTITI